MEKFNAFPTYTTEINKMAVNYHPNFLIGKFIAEKTGDSKLSQLLSYKNVEDKHLLLEHISEIQEDARVTLNDIYHYLKKEENIEMLSEIELFAPEIKKSTKSKPAPANRMKMTPNGGGEDKKKKLKEKYASLFKITPPSF